jgi:hypothetical protein
MFQWTVTASSSNISESQKKILDPPPKMKAVCYFKTLEKNKPSVHYHNLEALNPQHQSC